MKRISTQGQPPILIAGMPRSGTTWLGKLFDSHPDVVYRHEPDSVIPERSFPYFCPRNACEPHLAATREWFKRLAEVRTIKTVGVMPIFRKAYHRSADHYARLISIAALKTGELSPVAARWARSASVPDLIDPDDAAHCNLVIKSISMLGRVGLIARALPDARIIIVIRDPYGHVASQLRGVRLGKFRPEGADSAITVTPQAQRRDLTAERLEHMPLLEQLALQWTIFNEAAVEDTAGCSNVFVLRYHDLVRDPEAILPQLFAFAGLSWSAQTEKFLKASRGRESRRYFSIYRGPDFSPDRWRLELSRSEIACVTAVAVGSMVAKFGLLV